MYHTLDCRSLFTVEKVNILVKKTLVDTKNIMVISSYFRTKIKTVNN